MAGAGAAVGGRVSRLPGPRRAGVAKPARLPQRPGSARPAHNLPAQLTSFVGREREVAAIERLLDEGRLVTLTGVGGVGKTRLALRLAEALHGRFADGVWLVELDSLADPALVSRAVAAALGIRDHGTGSTGAPGATLTDRLATMLQTGQLLLVLDSCEHLLDACAALADRLLRACPELRILATSREPLGLSGETAWRVPSLSLPDIAVADEAELLGYEAVRLFVDRARAALPEFQITDESAARVVEICRRLDGIPLAIELAAARLRGFTLAQITERLGDRFGLLTAGSRMALPRHRTLRALIDWSYDLLSEPQGALLRRLSVFAGGFTLEAAAAIAPPSPITHDRSPVEDVLARLVEKSLVVLEEHRGQARYRLLDTIRQYAAERLRESGEEPLARRLHQNWCLQLAETAEQKLRTAEHEEWIARLETEHGNLRAAIAWSRQHPEEPAGPRLIGALFWFWDVRGLWAEALENLQWALAVTANGTAAVRAKLFNAAGILAYNRADYDQAVTLARDALALSRVSNDTWGICFALETLGLVTQFQGDHVQAKELLEESLALARANHDAVNTALSLLYLCIIDQEQGQLGIARERCEESLAIWRSLRSKGKMALALLGLGRIAVAEGRRADGLALLEQSLAVAREAGSPRAVAWSLLYLGHLARAQGAPRRAAALYTESLEQRRIVGDRRGVAQCLEGLAAVAARITRITRSGRSRRRVTAERTAKLLGAAEAIREAVGSPMPPYERAQHERHVAAARAVLGPEFEAAWQAGRAAPLDEAVAYALEGLRPGASHSDAGKGMPDGDVRAGEGLDLGVLSPREREIALLIAQGLSNHQIAATLVISRRTAETHASHILKKLGFTSRAQIATWAADLGLIAASHA